MKDTKNTIQPMKVARGSTAFVINTCPKRDEKGNIIGKYNRDYCRQVARGVRFNPVIREAYQKFNKLVGYEG